MHFTGTKSSPWILLLLKYKKCSARMEAFHLMQCNIMEKRSNQINKTFIVLDSRPKGRGFEPHRLHCVVVLEQDTFILA